MGISRGTYINDIIKEYAISETGKDENVMKSFNRISLSLNISSLKMDDALATYEGMGKIHNMDSHQREMLNSLIS